MARASDIHHQMWMLEGVMDISCGEQQWQLQAGDCVAMREDQQIIYANPGSEPARYLVGLVTLPFTASA